MKGQFGNTKRGLLSFIPQLLANKITELLTTMFQLKIDHRTITSKVSFVQYWLSLTKYITYRTAVNQITE